MYSQVSGQCPNAIPKANLFRKLGMAFFTKTLFPKYTKGT